MSNSCPICGGPAGPYRLGACSPGCDVVMGEGPSISEAILAGIAIIVVLILVVALLNPLGMEVR